MKLDKPSKLLKNKKVQAIGGLGLCAIIAIGLSVYIYNSEKVKKNIKVEDSIATENKEKYKNNKDLESKVKKQLEKLKSVDLSKLPEEDRKAIETEIKTMEDKINKEEYSGIEGEVEKLKNEIDNKLKIAEKLKEEKNEDVASGSTESNSTENISNENGSSNNTNNNEVVVEKQPSVTEEKVEVAEPVHKEPDNITPEPTQIPTPQPEPIPEPVVENPKPVYPSLAEVKQRLINYGQSLGYTYNSALEGSGLDRQGTGQMKDPENGSALDGKRLFSAMEGNEFGITVEERSDGYVWMTLWVDF